MSEKPLLLQSAKVAVLVPEPEHPYVRYARYAAVAFGLLCVLVGAADISTRLSEHALGDEAGFVAFAPAAALGQPAATTTAGALVPATLNIPSLGVRAKVESVGQKADGTMATPQNFKNVGWYAPGAKPGAPGSTVFAGHVNNALTQAGVFANLSQIKKGDYVSVADSAGKTIVYKVSEIKLLDPDADTRAIFATTGPEQLVLITCEGEWIRDEHQFEKRLVVVAKPAY